MGKLSMGDLLKANAPSEKDKRACERKRRYPNDIDARIGALATLDEMDYTGLTEMWIYRCPACEGWHTTTAAGDLSLRVTKESPVS